MNKTNYFRMRATINGNDLLTSFIEGNYLGIGWAEIGNVSDKNKEEIHQQLVKYFPQQNKKALDLATGYFLKIKSMKIDDIVIVPHENTTLEIFKVTSPYKYDETNPITPHKIGVVHIKTRYLSELSIPFKKSINSMITLSNVDKYASEIDTLIESQIVTTQQVHTKTFIRQIGTQQIVLTISDNITKEDLQKLISEIDI